MHPTLFQIGPITIHSYGVMIALGVLAALGVGLYRSKAKRLDQDMVWNLALFGLLGGMVGAKLLYILASLPQIIQNPALLLDIGNGFVVYGGIIGGVLTAWFYCRRKKVAAMPYFDLLLPSVSIAQGFGRIGCLLAGCCYGQPTDAWYGIVFSSSPHAPNNIPLFPSQILSAGGDFAIALILILQARRQKYTGQITENYLLLYSVGRFLIEFTRNDFRGNVGALSTSQFISLFIFLFGIGLKWWNRKRKSIDPAL